MVVKQRVQILLEYIQKGMQKTVAGTRKINESLQGVTNTFNQSQSAIAKSAKKHNNAINSQQHAISNLSKKQRVNTNNTQMGTVASQGFFKTMRMGMPQFKDFNMQNRRFGTLGGQTANRFRMATHGMRGFRMEMLGTMFFGMMLQRVFTGLLRTSMEWMGIMELASLTLGVVFLPVAEELLLILMPIMDWFMNLSDGTKLWLGRLVILAAIMGGMIFIIGQFALGIGSIILAWGLIAPIFLFTAAIVGVGIVIWAVISIIKNWGKSSSKVIKAIGIAIMGIGFILLLFIGWWALIPIAVGLVIALIASKWDTLPGIIKKPLQALWWLVREFLIEPFMLAITIVKELAGALKNLFTGNWKGIGDNFKNIGKGFIKAIPGFKDGGVVPGNIGDPVPILAHAGETVTPNSITQKTPQMMANQNQEIIVNNEYNITVSDKREFESMLEKNNREMTEDIRRIVKTG